MQSSRLPKIATNGLIYGWTMTLNALHKACQRTECGSGRGETGGGFTQPPLCDSAGGCDRSDDETSGTGGWCR